MENIEYLSIKEIVDQTRGICYGIVQPGTSGTEGIPTIKVNNLVSGALKIDDLDKTNAEIEVNYRRSRLKGGEILLSLVGSLGHTVRVTPEMRGWNVARAVGILPVADEYDPEWVLWCLRSPDIQHKMKSLASTSVQATLNLKEVNSLEIPYPPAHIRSKVVQILSSFQNKIELNRQLNATLEQLARSLFQSWFVDFDPVRAKASGEPADSICRRLGLTPELLALFPATLEESAMGEIPVGWEVDKVGNYLTVVDFDANGSFASLKENVSLLSEPGYALYVRTTDYNSGFSKEMRFVDESAYLFLSKSSLDGSETIISNVGDVGTVFRAPSWLGYPMTLGSNAVAIRAGDASNYVFQYFKGVAGQNQLQSIITGSAQLKFNKTGLRSLPLLIPEATVLDAYEKLATDLASQQVSLEAESRTLATLRDELLPKLLSGDIRLN